MLKSIKPKHVLSNDLSYLLKTLLVEPIYEQEQVLYAGKLLEEHHYLGDLKAVGERIYYAIRDEQGDWLGVLVFMSAARRLRFRDKWIGWSDEQRRRRLALVANNARFLLLPEKTVPNLGSAVLKRVLARLSNDWQERYDHPIEVVETFVDPSLFSGTVYTAAGWQELSLTQGHERKSRDYYQFHDRPKRLFVCALQRNSCRNLQAQTLKPSLAKVEAKVAARCTENSATLISLRERFEIVVPEYHKYKCRYPVYALLSIMAVAHLSGAPRGQKDLAVFAKSLSQAQRRALGIRRDPTTKRYGAPDQSTFSRMMSKVDVDCVEQVMLDWQKQIRGKANEQELIAIDGKIPKHSGGKNVVTASTSPSQHYLGCEIVSDKSNEIPAARDLFKKLDLDNKMVSLDAMHTQIQTAGELVLEHGADYILSVKDNQPTLRSQIERLVEDPSSPFLNLRSKPDTTSNKVWKKEKR